MLSQPCAKVRFANPTSQLHSRPRAGACSPAGTKFAFVCARPCVVLQPLAVGCHWRASAQPARDKTLNLAKMSFGALLGWRLAGRQRRQHHGACVENQHRRVQMRALDAGLRACACRTLQAACDTGNYSVAVWLPLNFQVDCRLQHRGSGN
jgi:hypothetical protein